jgi:hypothetical protein
VRLCVGADGPKLAEIIENERSKLRAPSPPDSPTVTKNATVADSLPIYGMREVKD